MKPVDRKTNRGGGAAPPSAEVIETMAADWLALQAFRSLTVAEQAALDAWLAADSRHRAAFAELESTWKLLDGLATYARPRGAPANPDFFTRRPPQRFPPWVALGAAAAVVLVSVLWLAPWLRSPHQRDGLVEHAASREESQTRRLPDGSLVELRAGSEIVEAFTATERGVRLVQGEAYFTVKKDAARPFIVRVGAISVRAVGTAFNVRLDATSLAVLVTEGLVRLNPPAALETPSSGDLVAAAHLAAGQRVVLPAAATHLPAALVVETVSSSEIHRALAWHDTPLVFESTPLSAVVSHFNRHNLQQLVLARAEVGTLRVSGRFRADNLEGLVELLESSFGLTASRRGDEIVLDSDR